MGHTKKKKREHLFKHDFDFLNDINDAINLFTRIEKKFVETIQLEEPKKRSKRANYFKGL
jgi:hypothetical protein